MLQRAFGRLRPRREPGWTLRAGIVVCVALALAMALVARGSVPNPTAANALIGHVAPPFTLDAAQGGVTLDQRVTFPGEQSRPTLLVFFNTLCVHCLSEISAARQAAASASGGPVDVLFIDTPAENAQITGAYMARLGLNPLVALDSGGAVASVYGVGYGPTLTLVDRAGVIRGVWIGETSSAQLRAGLTSDLRG